VAVLDWLQQILSEPPASAAAPASTGSLLRQQASRRPDILQMLQDALGTPPGRSPIGAALDRHIRLRGLPDAVKNSILYQPAYGEGEGIPATGAQADARNEALAGEAQGSSGQDYRNSPLMNELSMIQEFMRLYPALPDWHMNPGPQPGSPPPYPAPLPPAAQRFPFGLY
jgi:hypothetical protein